MVGRKFYFRYLHRSLQRLFTKDHIIGLMFKKKHNIWFFFLHYQGSCCWLSQKSVYTSCQWHSTGICIYKLVCYYIMHVAGQLLLHFFQLYCKEPLLCVCRPNRFEQVRVWKKSGPVAPNRSTANYFERITTWIKLVEKSIHLLENSPLGSIFLPLWDWKTTKKKTQLQNHNKSVKSPGLHLQTDALVTWFTIYWLLLGHNI